MIRLGICADCDSTVLIDIHGNCKTCNSNSTMVIGNERAKSMHNVRNPINSGRRNSLLRLLPKVQTRSA